MLIDFSVTNFASFKEEALLSAETGERLSRFKNTNTLKENNYSLLKNLLIFGPNGSGKTNLLVALRRMQMMVLHDPATVTERLAYQPYLFAIDSQTTPTHFKVTFNHQAETFTYEFAYTAQEICYEKLTRVKKTTARIYFERSYQDFLILPQELKNVAQHTKENSLLLYTAQNANDPYAKSVLRWFAEDLIFVSTTQPERHDELIQLIDRPPVKKELLAFLKFADIHITDIKTAKFAPTQSTSDFNLNESQLNSTRPTYQILTVHQIYNSLGEVFSATELPLTHESRGTQKVFWIALFIIFAQLNGSGKTLLFDEFDDSLHFELSNALIKIFNSKNNLNQFILTTHELQLLDCPVRVDQLYLVEKDFSGCSDLKSIFDFQDSRKTTRSGISLMKKYLAGNFGSIPNIDAAQMLAALNNRENKNGQKIAWSPTKEKHCHIL